MKNNMLIKEVEELIRNSNDNKEAKIIKEQILNDVINNLLDNNKTNVVPYNKVQTIRARYICKINPDKIIPIDNISEIEVTILKQQLYNYINKEFSYRKQKTIFEILPEIKKDLKNKSIKDLDIDDKTFYILSKARIYTIGHLVNKTKNQISKIERLKRSSFDNIIKRIHELNLLFADELTIIEQEESSIINPSKIEVDSIFPKNIYLYLLSANIFTLEDLSNKTEPELSKIRSFGDKKISIIKNELNKYGLNLKEEKDIYNDKEILLKLPLYILFPKWVSRKLSFYNINTLEELLEENINDLLEISFIGQDKIRIIDETVRRLGFKLREDSNNNSKIKTKKREYLEERIIK